MIVHQAISPKGYPLPFGILPQQLEVDEAIFVRIENALAIISALGDVVRQSHRNHSGNSGHLKIGGVSGELLAKNRDLRSPSPVSPRFTRKKSGFEVSVPDFPRCPLFTSSPAFPRVAPAEH